MNPKSLQNLQLYRILLIHVLLFFIFTLSPINSEADNIITLKVMSYNIRCGRGSDGKIDLERIANVIKSKAPDLVALQEVDKNTDRSHNVDQAKKIAELTGLHFVYGPALRLPGGEYGVAILSPQL